MVELDGDTVPAGLLAIFEPRTRAGSVLTGAILIPDIDKLETIPGVRRAERSRILKRELDKALPDARVRPLPVGNTTGRGKGVIVGVIDFGIDYRHDSFRNADGTTRILAIWDQALSATAGETTPEPYKYGVEYTRDAIDAALSSGSTAAIRHADLGPFHGTHVAGIAAGNGRPGPTSNGKPTYEGVAPEADLIVVANTRPRTKDPGTLGDSADTLDAVDYILAMADRLGRPVVINLSEGDNIGPHDGTSLLEVGIQHLIEQKSGRVLIKSAGNEGNKAHHAGGDLADAAKDLQIQIPAGVQDVIVDIWYGADDRLALAIDAPGTGAVSASSFEPPSSTAVMLADGTEVFVDADVDPGNGDHRTFVALQAPDGGSLPSGVWTFHLQGAGYWHAWIQRDSPATFQAPFANSAATISIPGTSRAVITVASHISNNAFVSGNLGALSEFSGRGPTRNGGAPALSAPGAEIKAPQPGGFFVGMSGTSMSAAMVSGAAALLLEIDGTLTADRIRTCLVESARADAQTGTVPNPDWGAGKLDVEAAAKKVVAGLTAAVSLGVTVGSGAAAAMIAAAPDGYTASPQS